MMLTRVANSLYWMGRYIERTENTTRLLNVANEFSLELENLDERRARAEWNCVSAGLPTPVPIGDESKPIPELTLDYFNSYLLDESNPVSVISSLARARENARSIGETLTREVQYNLNEAYSQLAAHRKKGVQSALRASDIAAATHRAILTMLGAIEHTLTRDQGWNYLKVGEAMERTQRTLFVLKAKLPDLQSMDDACDPALFFASWTSLLRSLASLENYRQRFGTRFEPDNVLRFMLFDPGTPRAVNCGVRRMTLYLNGLPSTAHGLKEATKVLGRLYSKLAYEDNEIMGTGALTAFLDEALTVLTAANEYISAPTKPF